TSIKSNHQKELLPLKEIKEQIYNEITTISINEHLENESVECEISLAEIE
ncbi:9458_t:CDS:1, partial [Ambispora gerdemannii]